MKTARESRSDGRSRWITRGRSPENGRSVRSTAAPFQRGHRLRRLVTSVSLLLAHLAFGGCLHPTGGRIVALHLVPTHVGDAAAGEACVLLVTADALPGFGPPDRKTPLRVACDGAEVNVVPAALASGEVAELRVVPDLAVVGEHIEVVVSGDTRTIPCRATLEVTDPPEHRGALLEASIAVRDAFVPWLESRHPELGIDAATEWEAVPIRTHRLVVTHCVFLSTEWECVVWWHVTIPPHDWARMSLRRRFADVTPTLAPQIASRASGDPPQAIDPPDEIIR